MQVEDHFLSIAFHVHGSGDKMQKLRLAAASFLLCSPADGVMSDTSSSSRYKTGKAKLFMKENPDAPRFPSAPSFEGLLLSAARSDTGEL